MRAIGIRSGAGESKARERVLAEAFVLFYVQGIRAVGIDLLIGRSGVAKATFYRHFPSKEDLVLVYLDRRNEAWLTWLRETVEMRSTSERLLAIFDALDDLFADPQFRGSATINAMSELGSASARVRGRCQEHAAALQDYLSGLAADGGRSHPSDLAQQLLLLVDGAFVAAQRMDSPNAARVARNVAERLLDLDGRTWAGSPAN